MYFRITTKSGVTIGDELSEDAPAVRLDEGRVENGGKHPVDLVLGEQTEVSYPLLAMASTTKPRLFCNVRRIEEPGENAPPIPVAVLETTKAETPQVRRGGRRSRRAVES